MWFDKDVTLDLLKKQNINIDTITLEEFDDLIKRIKDGNKNVDVEREYYVRKIVSDLEEITGFKHKNINLIERNPFKTEVKSGLVNLLLISNKFPYLIYKQFSIKKKESIEDVIAKNISNENYLYYYEECLNVIKLLENHFEQFKLTKDLNLKDSYLNIDITIPTNDFLFLIKNHRILCEHFELKDYLEENYDLSLDSFGR